MCECSHMELKSLMAWGKKLSVSLTVKARMLLYLLPDGRRVKNWCEVCVGSFAIQIALWIQRVV